MLGTGLAAARFEIASRKSALGLPALPVIGKPPAPVATVLPAL